VRTVAAPGTIAGTPLLGRRKSATIDGSESLDVWEWPRLRQLLHPLMQTIVAPIEIHQEATFNDLLRRHLDRLRWARVHRLGTYVQTGGWQ
jgi:hypothetical protein